jgi:hypothetical protein
MWIELDGSYFDILNAFALRPVGKGNKQCTLFSSGSSPVDGGFLIDLPIAEVFQSIQQARLLELTSMMEAEDETEPDPDLLADNSATVDGTR